jgi:hypothetical protein
VIYDCGIFVIFQSVFRILPLTILLKLAILGSKTFELWTGKQHSTSLRALRLSDGDSRVTVNTQDVFKMAAPDRAGRVRFGHEIQVVVRLSNGA